jgi:hypothetical protein
MKHQPIDLTYPKKFICVLSASYPSEQLDFNQIAQHIAKGTNRTPLERMEELLTEKTYVR